MSTDRLPTDDGDALATALAWAAQGFHVFPCAPEDKTPLTDHGFQSATTRAATIEAWATAQAGCNWACWPGASGFVVLDFDPSKSDDAGRALHAQLRGATAEVTTPSGGVHHWYRLPDGVALSNATGALPSGWDVRSANGYVLIPPAVVVYADADKARRKGVPAGHRGVYSILRDGPIVELPADILALIRSPKPASAAGDAPLAEPPATTADDAALLERLIGDSQRAYELYTLGQVSDHSEDDYELCRLLVEAGAGPAQIDRLFRASKLMRPKWDAKRGASTYGAQTIDKALEHGRGATMTHATGTTVQTRVKRGDSFFEGPPQDFEPPWPDDLELGPAPTAAAWSMNGAGPHTIADDDEEQEQAHPLDVTPTRPLQLGWVDDYANHAALRTASPLAFNRLAALVLAATAIRRRAVLRMAWGPVYANIFGAMIAPSTVYHKTTALGLAGNLLWRAQLEGLTLPAEFTPEGLLRGLASQSGGLVRRDEIGRLFDSHNVKYLREVKPMLTELFDGNTVKKQLSHEVITVANPCLNILGATTPARFYESVGLLDWRDGFLPRWLFALPEGEPDFDAEPAMYSGEDDARFGALAATLAELDRQRDTDFAIDGDAFDLWRAWRKAGVKAAYDYGDDVVQAIIGRYATHALKFALILAAVNGSWGRIDGATMQSACDLADHFKGVARRMLAERDEHELSGAKLQKVYQVIFAGNRNRKPVTERMIMRALHMAKAQVGPVLERLCDNGAVVTEDHGKTTLYLPSDLGAPSLPIRGIGK